MLIPVTLVTIIIIVELLLLFFKYVLPAEGILWDVATKLEKVGVSRGTGEATTLAHISVMCSL